MTTTRNQAALDRAVREAQERHIRNHNAMVAREVAAEAQRQAQMKPPELRSVK